MKIEVSSYNEDGSSTVLRNTGNPWTG